MLVLSAPTLDSQGPGGGAAPDGLKFIILPRLGPSLC